MRPRKAADKWADIGQAKREVFLEGIKAGMAVIDACHKAGWAGDPSYRDHRRRHPQWAAQVDVELARWKAFRNGESMIVSDDETPTTFAEFVGKWFPDRRPHMEHQVRIAETLAGLGPKEIVMILIWPEAGKTATLEDYICRKLAFDNTHRFRYVSEGTNLSKRVVGTCKRRFTDPEYQPFITRYGPFYEKNQERDGRPWTTEEIMLANNPARERDYNLVASSWKTATYGSRIDTLVLDDLQSQRNYNQAEEIVRQMRGTFFNRGLQMRTLIIGTRIGPGDVYERFLDAGLITRQIILPAADLEGNPTVPSFWDQNTMAERGFQPMRHDGRACCMGFRSCPRDGSLLTARETLELQRHQSGEETWWGAYMQNPRSDARSTFSEYLERCLDRDRRYGPLVA